MPVLGIVVVLLTVMTRNESVKHWTELCPLAKTVQVRHTPESTSTYLFTELGLDRLYSNTAMANFRSQMPTSANKMITWAIGENEIQLLTVDYSFRFIKQSEIFTDCLFQTLSNFEYHASSNKETVISYYFTLCCFTVRNCWRHPVSRSSWKAVDVPEQKACRLDSDRHGRPSQAIETLENSIL